MIVNGVDLFLKLHPSILLHFNIFANLLRHNLLLYVKNLNLSHKVNLNLMDQFIMLYQSIQLQFGIFQINVMHFLLFYSF